jgi:hypothetical protein
MTAPNADALAYITSVRLHIVEKADCHRAASIITRTPDITELSLYSAASRDWTPLRTYPEVCRDFLDTLFNLKDTGCQFQRLRSLIMNGFALTHLALVLSQSINFSKLEDLRLVKCEDVGHMLLSLGLQQVGWKTLRIEEEECIIGDDSGELKTFLQTMHTPRMLSLSLGRERSYAQEVDDEGKVCWTDLMPHISTLTSLRFNIDQHGGSPFDDSCGKSVADFREFCKLASNLDQLALVCPPIEEEQWQGEHGFAVFLVRTSTTPIICKQC